MSEDVRNMMLEDSTDLLDNIEVNTIAAECIKLKRKEVGSAGDIGVELEVRMIDENDILLVSDEEPDFNRHKAGYINMGGAQQMTKLHGND